MLNNTENGRRANPHVLTPQSISAGAPCIGEASLGIVEAPKICVTFFPNQSAQSKRTQEMSLAELGDLILKTNATSKDKLPWLKLATFGEKRTDKNCLRHNDNVLTISGIELDYDAKQMKLGEAVAIAKKTKLQALLYTSASYTDGAPKWRILLPTSKPLPPAERAKLVARVNGVFRGIFDGASFVLSQAYYYGSVNNNPAHRAGVTAGDYVDLRDDLDAGAIDKNGAPLRERDHFEQFGDEHQHKKAPAEKVIAALAVVVNKPTNDDSSYNTWIDVGHEIKSWDASEVGWRIYDAWGATWPGKMKNGELKTYNKTFARERWDSFHPTRTNIGALFNRANAISPGWWKRDKQEEERAEPEAEKAYAEAALRNVANILRDTPKDYRNDKLYQCAFRLGTMVAREWIARDVAKRELEKTAKVYGLVDWPGMGRKIINTGLDEGMNRPHSDLFNLSKKKNTAVKLMQTSAEFVAGFAPPDYLIDGLMQRRYVYSFTSPTGGGKTTIALLIAAHVALGKELAGKEVEKGRVLFFAGENPDDVRSRWIKLCEAMDVEPETMDVVFMPFTPNLAETREKIDAEAAEHGPFVLLIVDTSAAYYTGDDENDNVALGNHARMLRTFIELPGGPTILVTCHPTKTPNMENLLPRGGGAFLAEVDGNLVCVKDAATMVVEVTTHGKFRGPDFAPFSFKLVAGKSEKLVDSKGREIWSIFARPISKEEQEVIEKAGHSDQDEVLRAMLDQPGRSLQELAVHLRWRTTQGEANRQKVHRVMKDLQKAKLVEVRRDGHYALKKKGEEEAAKTPEEGWKRGGTAAPKKKGTTEIDFFEASDKEHEVRAADRDDLRQSPAPWREKKRF